HIHEPFRLASRRRVAGAKAGGNQTILIAKVSRQNGEADGIRGAAIDHTVAIEGIDAYTIECRVSGKLVHREVIGVRPQTELRVVTKIVRVSGVYLNGIEVPPTCYRVASLADTYTLPE